MMQRDQFDYLASLPRPACDDATEGEMIDVVLRGWAELIGNEIRLSHAGRSAVASYKAEHFTSA